MLVVGPGLQSRPLLTGRRNGEFRLQADRLPDPPHAYLRTHDSKSAAARGSASGAQKPSASRRRQPSACSKVARPVPHLAREHPSSSARTSRDPGSRRATGAASDGTPASRPSAASTSPPTSTKCVGITGAPSGIPVAVRLRVVDRQRAVHWRRRRIGREVRHPARERRRHREAAGVFMVFHVIGGRMGEQDVRADATQDCSEPAQGRSVVEHLEVADQALVICEPAVAAGGHRLIAPYADQLLYAHERSIRTTRSPRSCSESGSRHAATGRACPPR